MRAVVDPEICIGCTLCTQICPGVYKMQGDKAVAYTNIVPEEFQDTARDAASQCPVDAIDIEEI